MPIFEYQCRACQHRFEALVRKGDSPACPACKSADLEKILSSFGVSSEGTRQSNLQSERKIQSRVQRDKAIAEHEAAHHSHEH
ncbi:MAG TPA: zinc ribbon domain-containing protein [Vicinamibacterales bacterium]|jgi:putative FmdB family regulatory protein